MDRPPRLVLRLAFVLVLAACSPQGEPSPRQLPPATAPVSIQTPTQGGPVTPPAESVNPATAPSLPLASATAPAPQIEQASPMSTPPPTPTTLATTIPAPVPDNTRAYLGIVPDPTARASTVGVLIQGTQPDSPAEAAGLRAADLIIEIDGRPIANLDRLGQVLDQSRAGQSMTITVLRGVTRMNLTAKLARPPDAER